MADIPIPFYGVHGFKHFLAALTRVCPRTLSGLIFICALLSACTDNEPSATSNASGPMPPDWRRFLDTDESGQDPLLPVSFPTDLTPHPDASAESFAVRALVFDQQQRMSSVFVQLDRIRLRENTTSESEWSYSSVFRAQSAIASDADMAPAFKEQIERGALGLANSEANSLFIGINKLQIVSENTPQQPCAAQLSLDASLIAERSISLASRIATCPDAVSVGSVLNQWEVAAVPVTGVLANDPVNGHAWITHAWGQAPQAGGAVLLDQLRLRLTNDNGEVLLLSANRSKRRSGTGPVTVLGQISSEQGDIDVPDLQWSDVGAMKSTATGFEYPTLFRITSTEFNVDLELRPIAAMSEIADTFGPRWASAVSLSGSHAGMGFVDMSPVRVLENER